MSIFIKNKVFLFNIIVFVIATNILLYIVSRYLGLARPIINTDYLLVYLLFLLFPYKNYVKAVFLLLAVILSTVDIILFAMQVFPFIQLNDLFYLSTFIFTGPDTYQKILVSAVIYIAAIYLLLSSYFFKEAILNKKLVLLSIVAVIFISVLNMTNIRSQLLFFIINYNHDYNLIADNKSLLIPNKYDSISSELFDRRINDNDNKKILFIVNESWGVTNNPVIQQKILSPIYKYKDSYSYIDNGGFNFVGATVSGELRELCQKNATVMDIEKVADAEFIHCLPDRLSQQGYETYTVHGASSTLYDRSRWYLLAGFEHTLFKEDFKEEKSCDSFSGKCDYDLFDPIANIMAENNKIMLYWLTLNTHAPYNDRLFIDGFDCESYSIKPNSESCFNLKQQYQFFYRLSEYIKDARMKGVDIYIVGDHAPPIVSLKDNYAVFKDMEVGWLKFSIKR